MMDDAGCIQGPLGVPFELVDSHIHYWLASTPEHPWMEGGPQPDKQPWPVERLLAEARRGGVSRVVQVVPSLLGYDNRYSFAAAERYPDRIVGVFARIDPLQPDMGRTLAALCAHPKFMGIRLTFFSPVQKSWLVDDAPLRPLFEAAAREDFPIAVFARGHARELARLARNNPDTRFFMDHMAMDWRDPDPFHAWKEVLAMAAIPNIVMKPSYFPEACHAEPYPYRRGKHLLRELHEHFGEDRLIWGTNYPPSKEACTYGESVDFMLDACSHLGRQAQAKIFGGNLLAATARAGRPAGAAARERAPVAG